MDIEVINNFQSFLILLIGMPLAALISMCIVAKYVYDPLKEKIISVKTPQVIPYENRYPFIHDPLICDISGRILKHALVLENTPQGYILMSYNEDNDAFEYWADENIQYKYLESVARKYVQSFHCEHLYINRYELLRKRWLEIEEAKKKALEEKKEEVEESVFAVLKSAKKNKEKNKLLFQCEKANKYIARGRMNECEYFNVTKQENNLSFDDWKKITLPLTDPDSPPR